MPVLASIAGLVLVAALTPTGQAAAQGMMNGLLVRVINDAANPVPVRDAEASGRQPFQTAIVLAFTAGERGESESFQVPIDKRLVIEDVSVSSPFGATFYPASFRLTTTVGSNLVTHGLFTITPDAVASSGITQGVTGRTVRIYADPGTVVTGSALLSDEITSPSLTTFVRLVVSGYLTEP